MGLGNLGKKFGKKLGEKAFDATKKVANKVERQNTYC